MTNKILKFGEDVEGYNVPVLNEREVRASAGILFVFGFASFMVCQLTHSFVMLKYVITIFFMDMGMRVFINPKYSPSLILGRLMVRNQTPEYVGARPKRFAWSIGVALATLLFSVQVLGNVVSPITGITCLLCLTFLFFEASFGICLGCLFYSLFYKEKAVLCPGDICEPKLKQDIQKTSMVQVLILAGFVIFVILLVYFFQDFFKVKPYDIFGMNNPA